MRISDWSSDVCSSDLAWLTAAAKRRLIDGVRHDAMRTRKEAEITRELDEEQDMRVEAALAALDDPLGDELLGLIFAACHPVISPEARAALTLRLVGGLTVEEIARAFLSNEADRKSVVAGKRGAVRVSPRGRRIL